MIEEKINEMQAKAAEANKKICRILYRACKVKQV